MTLTSNLYAISFNGSGVPLCRWRVVADAAMGKSLEMFIVHDHHDLHVLRDIVRMLNIPLPPVTISRFDVPQHTISPERTPPQDKLTILHILRCTDPKLQAVVMNAIVDQVWASPFADALQWQRFVHCLQF